MAFLVTILICRGLLLFMQHHKFFPLQEIFTLGTKVAIANFLGKLSTPLADFIFLGHWLFFYLLGDAKHVSLFKNSKLESKCINFAISYFPAGVTCYVVSISGYNSHLCSKYCGRNYYSSQKILSHFDVSSIFSCNFKRS
jgi:hypothetical protein